MHTVEFSPAGWRLDHPGECAGHPERCPVVPAVVHLASAPQDKAGAWDVELTGAGDLLIRSHQPSADAGAAPVAVGGEIDVFHTCGAGLGPMASQHHTAWLPVTHVTPLDGGGWLIQSTRGDGTALVVTVDPTGRDAAGDVRGYRPAVTS